MSLDALYIHIPFCLRKCEYCDFTSFASNRSQRKDYVDYLLEEMSAYDLGYFDTIYFGGGTPSLLEAEDFQKILQKLNFDEKTELTVECNPKTLNREKLEAYYRLGINRLSLGVQSFSPKFLKILGRLHSAFEAEEMFSLAREIGFQNLSLDLMFSLPGQSLEEVEEDLDKIISLSPEHISIYSLIWEEGTPFFEKLQQGVYQKTDNDLEAKMYERIIQRLTEAGYEHYEISNFAKPGFRSRHNQKYWHNEEYIGLGLGAAGYVKGIRYLNYSNFEDYYQALEEKRSAREQEDRLSEEEKEQYKYLLAFRQIHDWILAEGAYQKKCEELLQEGYLEKRNEKEYRLTEKGLFFFNDMLEYFI